MPAGLEHKAVRDAAFFVDNNPDPYAALKPGNRRFSRVGLVDKRSPNARVFWGGLLRRTGGIVGGSSDQ